MSEIKAKGPNDRDQTLQPVTTGYGGVPSPKNLTELADYIKAITEMQHDYNTSGQAARVAAVAAFNYVAGELGLTGFQAGYAAMSLWGDINGAEGPYGLLKAEDLIYPQYNLGKKAREMVEDWLPWAAKRAKERLDEGVPAAENVKKHWQWLVDNHYYEDN